MASVVNARDLKLSASTNRVGTVFTPSNVITQTSQVVGLDYIVDGTKVITLECQNQVFVVSGGVVSPEVLRVGVVSKNITMPLTVSVVDGNISPVPVVSSGYVVIPYESLLTSTARLKVEAVVGGESFAAFMDVAKAIEDSNTFVAILKKPSAFVQADASGNILSYSGAATGVVAYYGALNVSAGCSVGVSSNPSGVGWTANQEDATIQVVGGLTTDSASLGVRVTNTQYGGDVVKTFLAFRSKSPSSSKSLVVTSSAPLIRYSARTGTYTPATITVRAQKLNISGAISWVVSPSIPYSVGASGDTLVFQTSALGNEEEVLVTASAEGLSDEVTLSKIPDPADSFPAYVVVLSNEAHSLTAGWDGTPTDLTGAYTDVTVYQDGVVDTQAWDCSITPSAGVTGHIAAYRVYLDAISTKNGKIDVVCKRKDRDNLLQDQDDVSSSSWTKSKLVSSLSDSVVSPEGLFRVYKLSEDSTSGSHYVTAKASMVNSHTYYAGVRVKASGRQYVKVGFSGVSAVFSLTDGVKSSVVATSAGARALGDGWWLVYVIGVYTGTTGLAGVSVNVQSSATVQSYLGDSREAVLIAGAKLADGAVVEEYVPQPDPVTKTFTISKSVAAVTYTTVVESDRGTVMKPGDTTPYTITAKLFANDEDVTDSVSPASFMWTKKSTPSVPEDAIWNAAHSSGYKSVAVTSADISRKTQFTCKITF